MIEALKAHQPATGRRDFRNHCTCGWFGEVGAHDFLQHQAEALETAAQLETKAADTLRKLLDLGKQYDLGGTGEPVGIVVIYPQEAFINASWGGIPEDRMKALVDAAAGEGMKDK